MFERLTKLKAKLARVLCHRVCDGLAAAVYGAAALGVLGKGEASAALCLLYLILTLRG